MEVKVNCRIEYVLNRHTGTGLIPISYTFPRLATSSGQASHYYVTTVVHNATQYLDVIIMYRGTNIYKGNL